MRERINRLAKGIVDSEIPELSVEPSVVEETVQAGELTRKELIIADAGGGFIKGLVYSSNFRVKIKNNAFGGIRNRIVYQVDSTYLTQEDVITGAFYLVTSGGERKVPYSFSVELGVSGKTLESLKTPDDFCRIARMDHDLALRLFEYQDFVEAPFMQNIHIRTLYDGLKGGANRQNLLEEFLVGLKVKDPVELEISGSMRSYENLQGSCRDQIEVRSSTWGYVRFDVTADGDFIELLKKSFTTQDFKDGVCQVPFIVNAAKLHGGRNLGAVRITTVRSENIVRLEAQGSEEQEKKRDPEREDLTNYMAVRLEYEAGICDERMALSRLKQETERLRRENGETLLNNLLQAELCLAGGQGDKATALLENCRPEMLDKRQEERVLYCYYQYLLLQVQKKDGQRENLIRLVGKYLSEDSSNIILFMLRLRLEPGLEEDHAALLELLRDQFGCRCHSPFLYAKAFRIYEQDPSLLRKMDEFELQAMNFAVKRDMVGHELALRIADLAGIAKYYNKLYCRLLIQLHDKYKEKEFLSAVCCMLIKGDHREPVYFCWYRDALEAGVSLTGLYEYFLYALPKDYPYLLPKEVLMYFSYEKSMDDYSRSVLYMNILRYMKTDSPLYRQYEREIEKFSMEQLLKARINRRLVVLYQHMIYKEMIDEKVARVLPSILRSYRVRIRNSNIKYLVVRYEELGEEDVFPIQDGVAYVPLFLEHSVLLFQDSYGNRYANISYRKLPSMDKKDTRELEEQCYEMFPNHPMLRMRECREIVENGITGKADAAVLQRAAADLNLSPLYRRRILSRMIAYYQENQETEDGGISSIDMEYLLGVDLDRLSRSERVGVCETLIREDYIREAYEIIRRYGCEGIRSARLQKLCTQMILKQMFDEDEILLVTAAQLFSEGSCDSVLLDYLCEHFNGSTKKMMQMLVMGVKDHVETYDMPERLLAQMIFTGSTDRIDQVFEWYAAGRKSGDNLMKAYFTIKSVDYFIKDKPTGDKVFDYLEGAVHGAADLGRVPTVYLLALARHYAALPALDEDQKVLCSRVTELLMEEKRLFPWFKDLGKHISMPDSIMDKVVVEYKGSRDAKPGLMIRILPEEEEYHSEEMQRVFPGIFVMQKVLFEGEILEYQIFESRGGEQVLVKEGSAGADPDQKIEEGSRYAALNEMGLCLSLKEEGTLKEKMRKYLTDSAAIEELFHLM